MQTKFAKVLIANRGEIALRIMRTLRRLGIESVAVYHAVDAATPFVAMADECAEIFGETPTAAYLDVDQLIDVARAGQDVVDYLFYISRQGRRAGDHPGAGQCHMLPVPGGFILIGGKAGNFGCER